jgi:single-stranded DNA-binding protein
MNYATLLIKIITKPEQSFFDNDITATEFIGKFYQYRKNYYTLCKISVWGNLAYDIGRYYQVNDYLIVEGYLLVQNYTSNLTDLNLKTNIEIIASKVYPFALTKKNNFF